MVEDDKILVTKGATENRWRPAIDPLFRSAAVTYSNRVIGVILTGYLDDGTTGVKTIKRCGGVCIVQDPEDAEYPEMPKNVLNQIKVDYCVPVEEMGSILSSLTSRKITGKTKVPKDILVEAEIAKRVLSDLPSVNTLGEQVPFNCPGCGGVLWQVDKGEALRYRCHTGHAYTVATYLPSKQKKIEETMWVALRMFEERKNLLTTIAKEQGGLMANLSNERIESSEVHIARIRMILQSDDKVTTKDKPS